MSISRSIFALCATLLVIAFSLPSLAMAKEPAQSSDQAQKGTDEIDATVIPIPVAAGFGAGSRDREKDPPSTSIPGREIGAWTAVGVLSLCVLGLTGGWIGEHFTRDCNPELIAELCRQCGNECLRICSGL